MTHKIIRRCCGLHLSPLSHHDASGLTFGVKRWRYTTPMWYVLKHFPSVTVWTYLTHLISVRYLELFIWQWPAQFVLKQKVQKVWRSGSRFIAHMAPQTTPTPTAAVKGKSTKTLICNATCTGAVWQSYSKQ